jgi:NADPH:quinone reductase-like Zn-dependent oxidoreductase
MKAIVMQEYGLPEVLKVKEVQKPTPKENEILIKNQAASVNYGDLVARDFKSLTPAKFNMPFPLWILMNFYFGFSKPNITVLGSELAGEVEAVGKDVTAFQPGDQVLGYLGQKMGAYAEYVSLPEDGMLVSKPSNITYEEAATVPYGTFVALNLLRKVDIQPGDQVLVNGASGSIGSYAVQLAKHYGAVVTGVCGSQRMEFVKSLGADHVIDYTQEDFTQNGETYDVILDVLGRSSFSACKDSLSNDGVYLLASFKMGDVFQMLWTSMVGSKKVICAMAGENPEDLALIAELIEAGKIKTFVDQSFPIEQAADAHRYVESGEKQGPVVITM